MKEKATQDARLDFLVEEFKADSVQYKDLQTPEDTEGKRRILRSLMNVRMPRKMDEAVLSVQDEYLQERIRENGRLYPRSWSNENPYQHWGSATTTYHVSHQL